MRTWWKGMFPPGVAVAEPDPAQMRWFAKIWKGVRDVWGRAKHVSVFHRRMLLSLAQILHGYLNQPLHLRPRP